MFVSLLGSAWQNGGCVLQAPSPSARHKSSAVGYVSWPSQLRTGLRQEYQSDMALQSRISGDPGLEEQLLEVSRGEAQLRFTSGNPVLDPGTRPWAMKTRLKQFVFPSLPGCRSDALERCPASPAPGKPTS